MPTEKTLLDRLASLSVVKLVEVMERGVPLLDKNGNAVLVEGKPVFIPPSAAFFHAAFRRLKDCGVIDPDKDLPDLKRLMRTVRTKAVKGAIPFKVPPLSDGPDMAAREEKQA